MILRSGTKLKDNDPRVPEGTTVEVIHGDVDPLVCQRGSRIVRISAKRVYTDGKPRRTGFSVVPETRS